MKYKLTHKEGAITEGSQTDPRGLSWMTYRSGIEKARRKRMFSQQMVLGSSMEQTTHNSDVTSFHELSSFIL